MSGTARATGLLHLRAARTLTVKTRAAYTNQQGAWSEQPPSRTVVTSARGKVLDLLAQGCNNYYRSEEFRPAIGALIKENPTPDPGNSTFLLGQGTWQVFYAPHIASISSAMKTKFEINYTLNGTTLTSNVKYSNPVLGEGWLSAGGSLSRKYDDTVEVHFNRFWVDVGADALRPDVPDAAELSLQPDSMLSAVGRLAFFPQFAIFPVAYLDEELSVFRFPPLDSLVAVRRIA